MAQLSLNMKTKEHEGVRKYKWEILARDFNSPLFRSYIWSGAAPLHPKLFGIPPIVMGLLVRKSQAYYIADAATWTKAHNSFAAKLKKDYRLLEKYIDLTNKKGEKMNAWSETNIYKADLSRQTNKKLIILLKGVIKLEREVYAHGFLLPLLDFLGFSFVESNLEKFLRENVQPNEYQHYYDALTYPVENSFAQDQEEYLLKLLAKHDSPELRKAVLDFSDTVKEHFPKFWNDLEKHARNWGWVYYVYQGPAFTTEQFLGFAREFFKKNIAPKLELERLKSEKKRISRLRKELIRKLKPDKFSAFILEIASKIVWAKPRRKDYQSKTYFHSEKLLTEIGRRLSFTLQEVRSTPPPLLMEWLLDPKAKIDREIPKSAFDFHVCVPSENDVLVLWGKEAKDFEDNFLVKSKEASPLENQTELKGTPACRGVAKGIVKIINNPEDMSKMNDKDILVSAATTPSIVPAMKKAAAIVTDEGGLTCHAAIVSRELRTPCVVGLKIATNVLKDGDIVEVDAEKGIVRIISKT